MHKLNCEPNGRRAGTASASLWPSTPRLCASSMSVTWRTVRRPSSSERSRWLSFTFTLSRLSFSGSSRSYIYVIVEQRSMVQVRANSAGGVPACVSKVAVPGRAPAPAAAGPPAAPDAARPLCLLSPSPRHLLPAVPSLAFLSTLSKTWLYDGTYNTCKLQFVHVIEYHTCPQIESSSDM